MTATQKIENELKKIKSLGLAGGKLADAWQSIMTIACSEYEAELEEIGYNKTQIIQATLDSLHNKQ
jgi:hypothetical protein